MTLVGYLLAWIAISVGACAVIAVINYARNTQREREEAEVTARIRAQVEKIVAESGR